MDISHLTHLHLHIFVYRGMPQDIVKWWAESLSALPMRAKLEHVLVEFGFLEYNPATSVLPKTRHELWETLDRVLSSDKLDVAKMEVMVLKKRTESVWNAAMGRKVRLIEEDDTGLIGWVLGVCLPATRDKYYPGFTTDSIPGFKLMIRDVCDEEKVTEVPDAS